MKSFFNCFFNEIGKFNDETFFIFIHDKNYPREIKNGIIIDDFLRNNFDSVLDWDSND